MISAVMRAAADAAAIVRAMVSVGLSSVSGLLGGIGFAQLGNSIVTISIS